MGFWDFLHGNAPRKSEAEAYMEIRNKEYARKAAEYKRRESIANLSERLGLNKNVNRKPSQTKKAIASIMTIATKCNTEQYHKHTTPFNCGDCGKEESIYDSGIPNMFVVENAFAKPSLRTVTASGEIIRGSFKVGDEVTVSTSIETRTATIQRIIRNGESTSYANTASGKIAIVLSNAADMMVRSGDMISKKK